MKSRADYLRQRRRDKRIDDGTLYLNIRKSKARDAGKFPTEIARLLAFLLNSREETPSSLAEAIGCDVRSVHRWLYDGIIPRFPTNVLVNSYFMVDVFPRRMFHPNGAVLYRAALKYSLGYTELGRIAGVSANVVCKYLYQGTEPGADKKARINAGLGEWVYDLGATLEPSPQTDNDYSFPEDPS